MATFSTSAVSAAIGGDGEAAAVTSFPESEGRGPTPLKYEQPKESQAIVPWMERIQASIGRSRKIRGANFVQIATVGLDNRPQARTVVFRGFQDVPQPHAYAQTQTQTQALRMITDMRSAKVAEIRRNPACELVYWFGKSSEQYRIQGDLQIVGPATTSTADDMTAAAGALQAARKQQWGNLSDAAREQFWWDAPGPYVESSTESETGEEAGTGAAKVPSGGRAADGSVLPPPETFALLLLHPRRVKYLRLTDNFAQTDALSATAKAAAAADDDNDNDNDDGDGDGDNDVLTWESSRVNP